MKEVELNIKFKRPIDYLTYQLKHHFYDLSENELKMLALIYLKGLNNSIKNEIVSLRIFKSRQSVENHLTKFRKNGIITKDKVNIPQPLVTDSRQMILKVNMTL